MVIKKKLTNLLNSTHLFNLEFGFIIYLIIFIIAM